MGSEGRSQWIKEVTVATADVGYTLRSGCQEKGQYRAISGYQRHEMFICDDGHHLSMCVHQAVLDGRKEEVGIFM